VRFALFGLPSALAIPVGTDPVPMPSAGRVNLGNGSKRVYLYVLPPIPPAAQPAASGPSPQLDPACCASRFVPRLGS
jgi:hypothetical protein